jgi:hypothetical protein
VELAQALRLDLPLQLRLQTDQGSIEATGHVAWGGKPQAEGAGVLHGVLFTEIAAGERRALQELIRTKGAVRQAGVRLPLDLAVTCEQRGRAGWQVQGRTGDMSRGGLLLRLPEALVPGTGLEITLESPQGQIETLGEVVWAESTEGKAQGEPIRHGVRFSAIGWSTALSLGLLLAGPLSGPPSTPGRG